MSGWYPSDLSRPPYPGFEDDPRAEMEEERAAAFADWRRDQNYRADRVSGGARYCAPHVPGEVWRPEIHGTVIRPAAVCARTYDLAGVALAEAAAHADIPIGVPIPVAVVTIIGEAMALQPRWMGTAAQISEQRAALAEWRARRDYLFERAREILDDAEFRQSGFGAPA